MPIYVHTTSTLVYMCYVQYICMYGTNHIKLNVLQAYLLCENARERGTGTGVPVPVPVLTVIDTSCYHRYCYVGVNFYNEVLF